MPPKVNKCPVCGRLRKSFRRLLLDAPPVRVFGCPLHEWDGDAAGASSSAATIADSSSAAPLAASHPEQE